MLTFLTKKKVVGGYALLSFNQIWFHVFNSVLMISSYGIFPRFLLLTL